MMFDQIFSRLVELKDILCNNVLSQFVYLDRSLIEHKLLPHDLLFIPGHAKYDARDSDMQELFYQIMAGETIYIPPPDSEEESLDESDEDDSTKDDRMSEDMSESEGSSAEQIETIGRHRKKIESEYAATAKFIQTCERVRRARILAREGLRMREIRARGIKDAPFLLKNLPYVIKIQAFWRGYYTRRILQTEETARQILMGKIV